MPRMKYKRQAAKQGGIEVELPLTTFQSCNDLAPGQVLKLVGTAKKNLDLLEDISMTMKKNEKSVCIQLLAASMGSVFSKKLVDKWKCVLTVTQDDKTASQVTIKGKELPKQLRSSQRKKTRAPTDNQKRRTTRQHLRSDVKSSPIKYEGGTANVELEACKNLDKYEAYTSDPTDAIMSDELGLISGGVSEVIEQETLLSDDIEVKQENDRTNPVHGSDLEQTASDDCAGDDRLEDSDTSSIIGDLVELDRDLCGLSGNEDQLELTCTPNDDSRRTDARTDSLKMLNDIKCMFCDKTYTGLVDPQIALEKHLLRKCTRNPWSRDTVAPEPTLSDKYSFKCQYCPKAFDSAKRLNTHQCRCARDPRYMAQFDKDALNLTICEICDRMFANGRALKSHKVIIHAYTRARDIPMKHDCRYCQIPFNCRGSRYHHETFKCSMNPNVAQLSYCRLCDRKVPKEKLDEHMTTCHMSNEEKVCEICGAVFPTKRRLYTHMYVHKTKPAKHPCPLCSKMFKMKNQMERHLSTHTDVRNVQCSVCGKFFKNRDQERDHRQYVHEGRYKYRCPKCGHGMAKKSYLLSHKCGRVRRIQDGETPVSPEIDKQTKSNVKLEVDVKFEDLKNVDFKDVLLDAPTEMPAGSSVIDNGMMPPPPAPYYVMPDNMVPHVMPVSMVQEHQMTQHNLMTPTQYSNFLMEPIQPTMQPIQPSLQQPLETSMHACMPQTLHPVMQSNLHY